MDLTIVIQPDIIIINILYISIHSNHPKMDVKSLLKCCCEQMTDHPYRSILWRDYGTHEQGGHIKFLSKSKYLATDPIQITQCHHFVLPTQAFALDYLCVFVEHSFTIS